jgi:hypothetical protein
MEIMNDDLKILRNVIILHAIEIRFLFNSYLILVFKLYEK